MTSSSSFIKPLSWILGFSGLTPFLFYSYSIENVVNEQKTIPKGDLLLHQYKQQLPNSFGPLLTSFEMNSQSQTRKTFIAYSSVILSFLGGVHFNAAYTIGKPFMLIASMAPSLLAWPAIVLSTREKTDTACSILSIGYIAMLGLDRLAVSSNSLSLSYYRLRIPLTFIVLGTHVWTSLVLRRGELIDAKQDTQSKTQTQKIK
jgi:hypothetical protein